MNKYSFLDILTNDVIIKDQAENQEEKILFSKIEIPMIQRDYAQGRKDQAEVRNRFLTAIFDALQNNNDLVFDFVYGSVPESKNTKIQKDEFAFIPLDGQQRLTTLFLLYWYIGNKESKIDDTLKTALKKFTYSTRTSSRSFCEILCETKPEFKLDNLKEGEKYTISKEIENLSWFFKSYKKDPTIKGMLNMLDAIHEKYADSTNLFDNLQNLQFYILPLDGFNLTEDLYIKMNTRGKQLTDFENFKADFEKHIKEKEFEENVEYQDTFAFKTDIIWTDLFWKHKNEKNEIDASYIKFIANVAMFLYAEFDGRDKQEQIKYLFNNPQKIKTSDFNCNKKFEKLKAYLDLYENKTNKFDEKTVNNLWNPEKNLFNESIKYKVEKEYNKDVIKYSVTYPQLVLFYAQTQYFLNVQNFNNDKFNDWMRVIRNIVQNANRLQEAEHFYNAIKMVKELSMDCKDIYTWLSNNTQNTKLSFSYEQVTEEFFKSKIIIQSQANKDSIQQIEDTNFCKGRINFALYCIDYEENKNNFDSAKLNKIKTVFEAYLNENNISNDFRRAMFTIGNNDFFYHLSWSFSIEMDKYCLLLDTNDLKIKFTNKKHNYLKELVNKLTNSDLKNIITNFQCPPEMPNWKQRLIKEVDTMGKSLLDNHCSGHYFGIPNNQSCCYLFYSLQRPRTLADCFEVT